MAVVASFAWAPARAFEPQTNYMLHCMGCHTPDGSGEPGRVPSVKATLVPFALLPEGRRYIVQVPGAARSPLSDRDLAAVLNWMMHNLAAQGRRTPALFTAAEVGRYRRTPLVEVRPMRARLLREIQ